MILFNRIVPLLSAIVIAITFEVWVIRPQWAYSIFPITALIVLLSILSLFSQSVRKKSFFNFLSAPLLFIIASCSFFLIIENLAVQQIVIAAIAVLHMLILSNIFSFLYRAESYQPYALENLYAYINMVSLFFFYATFYSLATLLGFQFWYFTLPVFILTSFLFTQTLWSYKIPWKDGRRFVFIIAVIITEASYAVSFLPSSFLINALIITALYYVFMNVFKDHLRGILDMKKIRIYLAVSGIVLLVSLLTARWH
ncbi:MAG: hypothetical protein WC505_07510 [Patescibacteria group bacterium]